MNDLNHHYTAKISRGQLKTPSCILGENMIISFYCERILVPIRLRFYALYKCTLD